MAPPLPTGHYIIQNDVDYDSVGNLGPNPPVQPVIRFDKPGVWTVRYLGGNRYLLDVRNFATLSRGSYVESNRTGVPGTTWIIDDNGHQRYTIIDPRPGPARKGWTLLPDPESPVVVLEPVPSRNVEPPQLWRFLHVVFNSEEEEDEDEDEDEEGEDEEK